MADRSVRVVLSAVTTQFSAGMAKAAADTKKLSDHLSTNRAAADALGTGMMLAGGAILAGVGVAAKAYADFDKAMSAVKATGADARDNMRDLSAAALKAGADTKYSATEAAGGVEALLKAGISARDVLGGGLAGSLSLAAAGEMGVADAAEVAATALTQFKLTGKDVGHVADLLAAGAGKAQGETSDLAMALKQGGLVASQFGLSIEETVGGLSAFASAGLLGSDAGTSLKSMLIALANPAGKSAEAMRELGINAYDASGKFVGLEGLAGQLHDRLGGLDDATRQQALAQIFGNDAIRAASILYDQGASGIAEWTAKVNDAGYATEVAQTKMDNLAGDIEQLGGSWETAMIKFGESSNGPLRGAVQALTGLVNAAADAPPELQTLAMMTGTVAGAMLVTAGGAIKLTTTLGAAKAAAEELGWSLKGMTLKAGAVGVVLAAAGFALSIFAGKQAAAQKLSDELRATLDQETGAITQNTRAYAAAKLQKDGVLQQAKDLGIASDVAVAAALGESEAIAKVKAATDAYLASRENLREDGELYTDGYDMAREAVDKFNASLTGVSGPLAEQQAKMREVAAAAGVQADATNGATDAASGLAGSTANLTTQQNALTEAANKQAEAIRNAANAQLQQSGSAIGLESAIDSATESVKEHGRNLDINTEAGRANRSALDTIASSALALQGAQREAGASSEAMTASTQRARDSFVQAAEKMGMSKQAAEALADSYGLIPKNVSTTITATIQQPNLAAWHSAVQARMNANPLYQPVNTYGAPVMRAGGGAVFGPGTGTSDSILSRLSNGEYVIKAASVAKIGLDRLDHLNRFGELPRFADGGRVHYASAAPRYAGGGPAHASRPVSGVSGQRAGMSGPVIVHMYGTDGVIQGTFNGLLSDGLGAAHMSAEMAEV